jgi:hypothetical protein
MSQNFLTYAKFGIVAVAVAGVFVLAALGKVSPEAAVTDVSIVTGALLAALGLSAGGSAVAAQLAASSAAKRAKKE